MNLGLPQLPEWMIKLIIGLTILGAFCAFLLFILGIYAAFSHIRWA